MNNNDDTQWDYLLGQLSWKRAAEDGGTWGHTHFVWCPKTTGSLGWMNCQKIVSINDEKARAQKMEIKMTWRASWNLFDADYDNVMFEEYNPVVTDNLVIGDGSADDGIAGFGIYNQGSLVIRQDVDGNNYFHNEHRTAAWNGMRANIDTSRFVESKTYRISWKYRTYSLGADDMRTQLSWKRSDNSWGHKNLYCPDESFFADPHVWQYCENNLTIDSDKAGSVLMEMKLVWNGSPTPQTENADYDELSWVCIDCE